ncbi:MAG: hypothetical protein R2856_37670 [Caldilineaceae bacterium]
MPESKNSFSPENAGGRLWSFGTIIVFGVLFGLGNAFTFQLCRGDVVLLQRPGWRASTAM